MMAKRPGHLLEAWKFSLYLGIPLLASWYYSDPARQRASADYWKYVVYPPNPANLKEQLMEQERLHREQLQQRAVYQEQLRRLDQLANQKSADDDNNEEERPKGFWSKLWIFGRSQ
ncbi:hypothetical protein ACA910_013173 [Epithemia clementina (nom. ined.)]